MISRFTHGVIDYVVGLLLFAAPFALGFADGESAQFVTMGLGGIAILYSLLTRYDLGLVSLIPYKAHLGLDLLFGAVLAASPWLFGFSGLIWWPHVLVGIASWIVVSLSWSTISVRT